MFRTWTWGSVGNYMHANGRYWLGLQTGRNMTLRTGNVV